jgi:hypothetical protein
MSPHTQAPPVLPRSSRPAVVTYALCGVVGALGFAAFVDDAATPIEVSVVAPVVRVVDADARLAVGFWQGADGRTLLLRPDGTGEACHNGGTASFAWRVRGQVVEVVDGGALLQLDNGEGQGTQFQLLIGGGQ